MNKFIYAPMISILLITNSNIALGQNNIESQQMLLISAALIQKGYTLHQVDKYHLHNKDYANFTYYLKSGTNYVFAATCDHDCDDIDLYLNDENNNLVSKDEKRDDWPLLEITPKWYGRFNLKVIMFNCKRNPCTYYIALFKKETSQSSIDNSSSPSLGAYSKPAQYKSETVYGYEFEGGMISRNKTPLKTMSIGFMLNSIPSKTDFSWHYLLSGYYHRYEYKFSNHKLISNTMIFAFEPGLGASVGYETTFFLQFFYLPSAYIHWTKYKTEKFNVSWEGYHIRTGFNFNDNFFIIANYKKIQMKFVQDQVFSVSLGTSFK